MERRQLLRWHKADPTQRVATPSRRWLILGNNPAMYIPYATKLTLTGAATAFLSTPTSAAIQAAEGSSWELRFLLAATSWLPAATGFIGAQLAAAGAQQCFYTYQNGTTRDIYLQLVKAGGGGGSGFSGTMPAFSDGSEHWIRESYDPATTSGAMYWSDDGVSWNLVGSSASLTLAGGLNVPTTTPIRVGAGDGVANAGFVGYIKRFEFRSPVGGAIVAGFDASAAKVGAGSCPGLNGETWTINGAAVFQ